MTVQFDIEKFESREVENHISDYWMRVSDQIRLLNRFIYLEWASARVIAGWIPGAEEFDWKCALSKMVWENMTTASRLRTRKEELSGNQKISIPSKQLETFVQQTAAADGFYAFAAGWFLEVSKDLVRAYERYLEALNPIFDAPTIAIVEELLPKKRHQVSWAVSLIHESVNEPAILGSVSRWRQYVRQYLQALGGVDQSLESFCEVPIAPIERPYGPAPRYRSKPKWLKQADILNPPTEFSNSLKTFMWHYATEIQVIDPMCYLFYGVDDMPFEFYLDFSRHIWDESRHHQMGIRRLKQMGYDVKEIPLPYHEDALQEFEYFYAMLTMVGESCSFNHKKKSMDAFYEKGDILSGMTAEIDIVDERSHVRYGKKWTPEIYKQRLNDNSSLDDIIRQVMDRFIKDNYANSFGGMSEEENKGLSHFAFCGKIEFKYLNYETT